MTALARKSPPEPGSGLWTADQFLEFYMSRPEGEHWQLIDGLAMMMVPVTPTHQKLGKNLLLLLDGALESSRPDLESFYELGLRIPGITNFNPEPDLAVIRRSDVGNKRYVDRFFLVAEIISPSNTAEMIERKLELYRTHPDNLYCLTVDQDFVRVVLYAREDGWTRKELTSLDDMLRLPAFGVEATLADIYKGTPLGR
jgi:Uma2 family endonuclease